MPRSAPAGTYSYRVHVGADLSSAIASDAFAFTKTSAAAVSAQSEEEWRLEKIGDAEEGISRLEAPMPNPSRDLTAVTYRLDAQAEVSLALYDALGRRVAWLDTGLRAAGTHQVRVETAGLPAGTYVVRLRAEGETTTQRLLVVR